MKRDDLINPYWIEDRDLKSGPVDYLPGTEVQFWKDLIEKYLEPLLKNAEKEKQQAQELITLRYVRLVTYLVLKETVANLWRAFMFVCKLS